MLKLRIDTRENLPLTFDKSKFDEITVECNPIADYWLEIDGKEVPVVFERKSRSDLYGTMTNGYPRFKKELMRAKEFGLHVILIIEGSMREIAKGYEYSKFSGDSMLRKLATLRIRYDLEVIFCNDRREMSRWIEEIFLALSREYKHKDSK